MSTATNVKLLHDRREVRAMPGVSETALKMWLAAGKFPKPDVWLGRRGAWKVETIRKWIEAGGTGKGGHS